MVNEQRELGLGWGFFLILALLHVFIIFQTGWDEPEQKVYDTVGRDFCLNNSEFPFTLINSSYDPPRVFCGDEVFLLNMTEYNIGLLDLVHYEVIP